MRRWCRVRRAPSGEREGGASHNGSRPGADSASRARRGHSVSEGGAESIPSPTGVGRLLLPLPHPSPSEDPLPTRRASFTIPVALVATLASACARDKRPAGADSVASAAPAYQLAGTAPAPIVATRYTVAPLVRAGRVRGSVEIEGTLPPDSVVR